MAVVNYTANAKEQLFNVLFVMRDSSHYTKSAMRNTILLFMIDMLQVLRVMLTSSFGWSEQSFNFARWFDVVHVVGDVLVSSAIPRVSLFVGAFLLVLFAVGDAFYCSRQFHAGEIRSMLPIKLLRFLVTLVVTTLYSSTIRWLLMPLQCLTDNQERGPTFSEVLHGEGALCDPWGVPEIAVTAPTLLLTVLYVSFATVACYFSLTVNTLSQCPRSAYTGRVELWFFASKVAATFTPFLAKHTSPILTPVVVGAVGARTLYLHVAMQPFQSHVINMLRGGTYCAVVYLAVCSCAFLGWYEAGNAHSPAMQRIQHGSLAGIPGAFLLGFALVHLWRWRVRQSLQALEKHFEETTLQVVWNGPDARGAAARGGHKSKSFRSALRSSLTMERQTNMDSYFRPNGDPQKTFFADGTEAVTAARVLLRQRQQQQQTFLAFVLQTGLREHPDCKELKVLNISLLRYLREGQPPGMEMEVGAKEERLVQSEALPLDLQYLLFAVDRKASQDVNAELLGKGGELNVIQVMEFEKKLQSAHVAHLSCVTAMKAFWCKFAVRKKKKAYALKDLVHACNLVEEYHRMEEVALEGYQTLRSKYPMSLQLLYEFASFAHGVLNDSALHQRLRLEIEQLEGNLLQQTTTAHGAKGLGEGDAEAVRERQASQSDRKSESTYGESSKGLLNASVFAASFLPQQALRLRRLQRTSTLLLVLLVSLSVVKFVVSDLWLYDTLAERDVLSLNARGLLRASAVSLCFLSRSRQLAAVRGDIAEMTVLEEKIRALATEMQEQHYQNAMEAHDSRLREFYLESHNLLNEVVGHEWKLKDFSYLDMGREVSRMAYSISSMTRPQLLTANVTAREMDPEQASLAFVNENIFRAILPRMNSVMQLYIDEAEFVWHATRIAIAIWSLLDLSMLAFLTLFTLAFLKLVHSMHSCYFAVLLAMSLPKSVTTKLHTFYERQEKALLEFDDEEEAIRAVVQEADAMDGAEFKGDNDDDDDDNDNENVHDTKAVDGACFEREQADSLAETKQEEDSRGAGIGSMGSAARRNMSTSLTEKSLQSLIRGGSRQQIWKTERPGPIEVSTPRDLVLVQSEAEERRLRELRQDSAEHPATSEPDSQRDANDASGYRQLGDGVSASETPTKHDGSRRLRDSHRKAAEEESRASGWSASCSLPVQHGSDRRLGRMGKSAGDIRGWLSAAMMPKMMDRVEQADGVPSGEGEDRRSSEGQRGKTDFDDGESGRQRDSREEEGEQARREEARAGPPPEEVVVEEVEEEVEEVEEEVEVEGVFALEVADDAASGGSERESEVEGPPIRAAGGGGEETARGGTEEVEVQRPGSGDCHGEEKSKSCHSGNEGDSGRSGGEEEGGSCNGKEGRSSGQGAMEDQPDTHLHGGDGEQAGSRGQLVHVRQPPGRFRSADLQFSSRTPTGSSLAYNSGRDIGVPWSPLVMTSSRRPSLALSTPLGSASRGWRTRPRPASLGKAPLQGAKRSTLRAASDGASFKTSPLQFSKHPAQVRTVSRWAGESAEEACRRGSGESAVHLLEVGSTNAEALSTALLQRESWVLRPRTHLLCLVVLLLISVLNTAFPATRMRDLVAAAPTINQAERRRFLMKACAHLSRELAIADRYARMEASDVASALRHYVDELVRSDFALRHGGELRVHRGIDKRGEGDPIAAVMYREGCPWRADPRNCSTPLRPEAAAHGLHNLMEHFVAGVEEVLFVHGPKGFEYTEDFLANPRDPAEVSAADAWEWVDAGDRLEQDRSLRFVLESFNGDLYQGLNLVVELFDLDSLSVIAHAHRDNLTFFVLYLFLLAAFYGLFFRSALRHALRRSEDGCRFAKRLPSSALSAMEVNAVRGFLVSGALMDLLPKFNYCNLQRLLASNAPPPRETALHAPSPLAPPTKFARSTESSDSHRLAASAQRFARVMSAGRRSE